MLSFNTLVIVAVLYVTFLFTVAFRADRRAKAGRAGWLHSPLIYTLSLSIYTTAWTFYGAVGSAARNGLEFLAIYLGPTLVFVGWWWFLRKLVRIGRVHRITSIADLLSSRYGKSAILAVIVTLLAVVGSTPYIALQLQSVALSFSVLADAAQTGAAQPDVNATAFWLAVGLAIFTIFFGTRNIDANERHHGVVTAIAVEAVVKLVALLAVGFFVVWGVADGPGDILARIETSEIAQRSASGSRWITLLFLSAAAIICLPRMFQVTVVENSDESHLATASWAFPLYLFLMSLFVLPIAVMGLNVLPEGSNPDLFVLTLPIAQNQEALAMLAFLGGFSSATSMVIVAAIALSTMVSNHIVMPFWLNIKYAGNPVSGDVRSLLIRSRRISIAAVLALGYAYFRFTGGTGALASIGLISFTGVAQVLPAMVGGIFWRGATRRGAIFALCAGFFLWAYTLFLPSFEGSWLMSADMLANGPWGIEMLKPRALFGMNDMDPLVHALIWSMGVNAVVFVVVSLFSFPSPMERLQGAQFVNVFQRTAGQGSWAEGSFAAEDLLAMAKRILGEDAALTLFNTAAHAQGKPGELPEATSEFVEHLERELAGSVGAATANAMVGQITGGAAISVEDLIAVADEAAQIMEHSVQLEAKSKELSRTAGQLRKANKKLTELSVQKDGFLSQISHELRTPMTSIRSFAEILKDTDGLSRKDAQRYSSIILDESIRLTRLLDEILDLSVLENGQVALNYEQGNLGLLLDRAVSSNSSFDSTRPLRITRNLAGENISIHTDTDRLTQVFINLISNAHKYCDADEPELTIIARTKGRNLEVDFRDNGAGIAEANRDIVFEKFSRLSDTTSAGAAGLGLAICREIMRNLGGTIRYVATPDGGVFRVSVGLDKG
jgi:Na+/proline symporter/nitrogen-specific signal transduction histidine kinase